MRQLACKLYATVVVSFLTVASVVAAGDRVGLSVGHLPAALRGGFVPAREVGDFLIQRSGVVVYRVLGPALDFSRNCQGCHGLSGKSVSEIPDLIDRVGYFARIPEGREYLIQVPNVAQSSLDDAQLANLMNWILYSFSEKQLPSNFKPYAADEVGALRKQRIEPAERRAAVILKLSAQGAISNTSALAWTGNAAKSTK